MGRPEPCQTGAPGKVTAPLSRGMKESTQVRTQTPAKLYGFIYFFFASKQRAAIKNPVEQMAALSLSLGFEKKALFFCVLVRRSGDQRCRRLLGLFPTLNRSPGGEATKLGHVGG